MRAGTKPSSPIADDLYDEHVETLKKEGLIDGEEF